MVSAGVTVRERLASTSAMPPRMAADAIASRHVVCSDRNSTAPHAAIGGTDNYTAAARMAVRYFSAAYQIT